MTQLGLTDAQVRDAFERRAGAELPSDVRGSVLAAVALEPQRWGWATRAAESFLRPDRRRTILALAAVALLIAAGAALLVVGMQDQPPNRSGRGLAFISGGDLWIAEVDGAHPRLVWDTRGTITASRPTWVDPDTMLVQDSRGGVYAVDLRTSTLRLLAEAGALLAVSADHLQVAIRLDRPDGPHLSIVEIASGLQVTDTLVRPVFVSPATPQIGPQFGLTGGPHAWSPDGRWLLGQGFDTGASATSGWIYQLDVQTGEIRDLATDLCCGLHQPNPVLAPDGSQVVYMDFYQAAQGERCDFRCGTLWSLDPVTLARQRLTETAGSEVGPVFSPERRTLCVPRLGRGRRRPDVHARPRRIQRTRALARIAGRPARATTWNIPRIGVRKMTHRPNLLTVVGVALAIIGCDATPPPTAPSSAVASGPAATVAVESTPHVTSGEGRPAGVPGNAQPFLFGCKEGVPRCTDIAPGTYYTAGEWALLPGLTFTLAAGWSSLANEAGELELHRTGDDHNEMMVWRDVVPWQDGRAAVDVASDPEAWIARLASDPCLNVSKPERVVLGDWIDLRGGKQADLEAIVVSVGISAEPAYQNADCPDTGQVVIMSDPMHWESGFTIGGDEMNGPDCPCRSVQRLYFASIGYVQHKHLLVVALQSYGPSGDVDGQMASLQAAAQPVLDSLIAPAIVVDN